MAVSVKVTSERIACGSDRSPFVVRSVVLPAFPGCQIIQVDILSKSKVFSAKSVSRIDYISKIRKLPGSSDYIRINRCSDSGIKAVSNRTVPDRNRTKRISILKRIASGQSAVLAGIAVPRGTVFRCVQNKIFRRYKCRIEAVRCESSVSKRFVSCRSANRARFIVDRCRSAGCGLLKVYLIRNFNKMMRCITSVFERLCSVFSAIARIVVNCSRVTCRCDLLELCRDDPAVERMRMSRNNGFFSCVSLPEQNRITVSVDRSDLPRVLKIITGK